MTQPHTQGNIFYHQAVGHSVPANNELLPNNAGSGGFPVNHQLAGHFELEGSPICRSFDSDSGDLTRNIADHKDQVNPFQGFLTNQRNRAQSSPIEPNRASKIPSPHSLTTVLHKSHSSDEEMMEEQLEHAPVVPQAPGGRRRKRKGQRDKAQDRNQKRKFQAKKGRERRHGQGGQPHPLGPQRQGGSQGEAWRDTGNPPQPASRFNPPTGPRAWRQQHGGRGTVSYE
ncbi:uncharacterized protein FFUJ_13049 [Fusarium fujikuroi IMI 58289]|uniref:Uncharacterized protein n=1 Tax=Gibberella fujikuroi (strain CBS 195.34 / IMI 58289 / NRRL A-6831) TaxID=1279085 RepID=S0DWK4_GIBF5|nr:uncharacterized protein FFUJ_13049 [Fusarium fujikuroi IMI 58289]QGI62918.1 hypothetical protein CEK27_006889 [Fusarium fujikuroi]QGI93804.1 hypothetical protein CEK26_006873 [Fusarium fujikuroi]CCT66881.1 uncharacterized protein FFUJ_13049 [Fusarium fujikuroi IMI 58289]SCN91850.1 uncharacterized protein FFC1_06584 [Fusarium fujikuroi]SCN95136.1 uncharacterized protein FFM5_06036 [Fusarium fujikuroi]